MDKVEYTPTQSKRFEISSNPHSRERLSKIKALKAQVDEASPFPVAMSLIGSLAKGKELNPAIDPSDIDIKFFVDSDSIKKGFEKGSIPEGLRDAYNIYIGRWDRLPGITGPLPESIYTVQDSQDTQVQMGVNFVKAKVSQFAKKHWSSRKRKGLPEILDTEVFPISMEGRDSILSRVLEYEEYKKTGEEDHMRMAGFNLAMLFGLDIGGGLKKYREGFINQLQALPPERGEELWKITNDAIRYHERQGVVPPQLENQFPTTLAKAAVYYNTHNKQHTD